ncbi:hypothetical protein [Microbacterium sp. GCS4]|uniref:hypothetical protein n=1 Tax=Microbacterium sp. GCS4 TaxID=1692239 RepID=UPI000B30D089|nr:hypothetical protein [Microbacterium sp. GCS4]
MSVRLLAWGMAWTVPIVSTIAGIVLMANPTVSFWNADGTSQFLQATLDVWPAGLVLLGAGTLGLTGVALAAALKCDGPRGVLRPFTGRTSPPTTTADARTQDSDRIG